MSEREPSQTVRHACVVREYGPFAEGERVHGVSYDGRRVWVATGARLHAIDPASGEAVATLETACDAGTAFDGTHLYQLAKGSIHKLDPRTGEVLSTLPAPSGGADDAGLTWAEGKLWVAQHRSRTIHQIDPQTGAILKTLRSDRFVTGVTWVDGELWHATLEGGTSELRRVDVESSAVIERLAMPAGAHVSGLESDGGELFYCGGAASGTVRAVRRPRR
ncbi:MAG: PQQ-binding-like beta-propeller repeat protein [Polyangiales bacterium]